MDSDQVIALIRAELQKSQGQSNFKANDVGFHTHNGIDSQSLFQNTVFTYVGSAENGVGTTTIIALMPKGWAVSNEGTGVTKIIHNLGTLFYSVVVVSASDVFTLPPQGVFQVTNGKNDFDVFGFDSSSQSLTNIPFQFILTVVSSKIISAPTYYGTLTEV